MLLTEERFVIKWLSQYHALPFNQVIRMLYEKPPQVAEKIIKNLKREHYICDLPGGYLALDPLAKADHRMIAAVWVLLQFDQVDPLAHYPATYPAQIYFLKEETGYEIVVLQDGEQHLTHLLQADEHMKYIIVLPDIALAQGLALPAVPILFAVPRILDIHDEPEITFYSQEGVTL